MFQGSTLFLFVDVGLSKISPRSCDSQDSSVRAEGTGMLQVLQEQCVTNTCWHVTFAAIFVLSSKSSNIHYNRISITRHVALQCIVFRVFVT